MKRKYNQTQIDNYISISEKYNLNLPMELEEQVRQRKKARFDSKVRKFELECQRLDRTKKFTEKGDLLEKLTYKILNEELLCNGTTINKTSIKSKKEKFKHITDCGIDLRSKIIVRNLEIPLVIQCKNIQRLSSETVTSMQGIISEHNPDSIGIIVVNNNTVINQSMYNLTKSIRNTVLILRVNELRKLPQIIEQKSQRKELLFTELNQTITETQPNTYSCDSITQENGKIVIKNFVFGASRKISRRLIYQNYSTE